MEKQKLFEMMHKVSKMPLNENKPLNESGGKSMIERFMYFCFNFPHDFISRMWSDDENLRNHLQNKFEDILDKRPTSDSAMLYFYAELDSNNRRIYDNWIENNYFG